MSEKVEGIVNDISFQPGNGAKGLLRVTLRNNADSYLVLMDGKLYLNNMLLDGAILLHHLVKTTKPVKVVLYPRADRYGAVEQAEFTAEGV